MDAKAKNLRESEYNSLTLKKNMLKHCNISWLMGYEKEAYLYYSFHYTGKKDFQESTPKIQMLMFGLAQTSHFGLWDIFSHILCKIWEYTYVYVQKDYLGLGWGVRYV